LLALADLADDALYVGSAADWASANEGVVRRTQGMFTEIRRAEAFDLTTLSVALRQLRNLALVTARPADAVG
jgi:NAD-specific glutamate dehydrogenase